MQHDFLASLWRKLGGFLQWRLLWLTNARFMIGVAGVVLDNHGRVLLLRHRFWPADTWGLPGGYAHRGERFEQTLAREVREETGLEVEPGAVLELVSGYRLRAELYFLARVVGGSLSLDGREIIEARFFALDALPDGLLASHAHVIDRVRTRAGA